MTMCGRVCFGTLKIDLSTVFAGQNESNRFECAESPFAAKVLPMSSV